MNIFGIIKIYIDNIVKNSYNAYKAFMLVLFLYFLVNEFTNYDIIIESSKDSNLYFGFPEPANPNLYGIIELHNFIMFFIVMIVFFTLITISEVLSNFSVQHLRGVEAYNKVKHIYNINIQHNTTLELFWTAIPFMTLFAIAIPSFAFLYAGELPRDCSLSLKVIAHQWFWSYELTVHLRDNIKPLYLYETISNMDSYEYQAYLKNFHSKNENLNNVSTLPIEFKKSNINNFLTHKINIIQNFKILPKLNFLEIFNIDSTIQNDTTNYLFKLLESSKLESTISKSVFSNFNDNTKVLDYNDYINSLTTIKLFDTKLNCKENLFFNKYCNNIERDCSINFESYLQPIADLKDSARLLKTTNPVVLPVGTYVKVLITSDDVIHSWALKDLGLKLDAAPGRTNQTTLIIDKLGRYSGQCSELCGAQHGFMPIEIFCVDRITFISYFMNESSDFFHIFYKTNFLYYLFELEKQVYSLNQIVLPDQAIQLFNKEMLSKKSFEYIAKNSWGSFKDELLTQRSIRSLCLTALNNNIKVSNESMEFISKLNLKLDLGFIKNYLKDSSEIHNLSSEKLSYIKSLGLNLDKEFKLIKNSLQNITK
jgi:heme/copper-type cytochrome/quinol oxidase subunit 2